MTETPGRYPGEERVAVGIDPASRTGIVAVAVPVGFERSPERWHWRGNRVAEKPKLTKSRGRLAALMGFRDAAAAALDEVRMAPWGASVTKLAPWAVVLEEPVDVLPPGRDGRGTAFALGEIFCAALLAARGAYYVERPFFAAYPVHNGRRQGGRPGWMPTERSGGGGNFTHTIPRAHLLRALHAEAVGIGAPKDVSEDELMAYGVLRFHMTQSADPWTRAAGDQFETRMKARRKT